MAEFTEEYFKGEEREGFYVEEMMKRAWAAQIEVLEIIDRFCKKYQMQYFADWGTLLGAVRHKGFIPWDDDIDIVMKRADYNRFMRIFNEERPAGCLLLNIYTNEEYNEIFARVVNSNRVNYTKEYLERWHGCPYAVGIDIFPLDKLATDEDEESIQCDLLRILIKSAYSKDETEETIKAVEDLCGVNIDRTKDIQHQFLRLADGVMQMYDEDGGDYAELIYYVNNPKRRMKPEDYSESIRMPFETSEIPVPKEYDAVLRRMYGGYEKPVRWVDHHDYPFYKKQQETVDRRLREKAEDVDKE